MIMERQKLHIKLNPIPVGQKTAGGCREKIHDLLKDFCDIYDLKKRFGYIAYDDTDNYYIVFPGTILRRHYYNNQDMLSAVSAKTKRIIPGKRRKFLRDDSENWREGNKREDILVISIPQKIALTLLLNYEYQDPGF